MRVLDEIDPAEIGRLRAAREFFWLDLLAPAPEALRALGETFALHPVVLEDLEHFGQRPKVDDYPDFVHVVFFGVEAGEVVEVHLVVHGDALITVRRDHCSTLAGARTRVEGLDPEREEYAVYRVLDALTDSYFPYLQRLDDQVDALEDIVLVGADNACLERIVDLKRDLGRLRRLVLPQRDIVAQANTMFAELPGFTGDGAHDYFRDVYDHLVRIADAIESYRDALTSLLDVYLSAQSNQLNEFVTKLTVLGTVFLPLTFLTGFFGQNFDWLVTHVDSAAAFWGLGVGLEIVSAVALYLWFRRREPATTDGQ